MIQTYYNYSVINGIIKTITSYIFYVGNSCGCEKRCMNNILVQDVLSNIVFLNKNFKK
ncbi:MAG: hypothetical protein VYB55_02490 [Bacteroidota bacterium]|nr:hypothetical protein [Bacteroidota bacterium]